MATLENFSKLNVDEEDDEWEDVGADEKFEGDVDTDEGSKEDIVAAEEAKDLVANERTKKEVEEAEDPDQELADFTLCWRVNLSFQTPIEDASNGSSEKRCTNCDKLFVSSGFRSEFASRVARCAGGHDIAEIASTSGPEAVDWCANFVSTCPECDQHLVHRIATRQQPCFRDGCQRTLQVDVTKLQQWMSPKQQQGLFEYVSHRIARGHPLICL